jgi:predicted transcriptional regulator
MQNPIRRVRPEKTGIRAPLGELEQAVMHYLWTCGSAGAMASDVQRHLEPDNPVAITTILTTLERLAGKGIVRRQQETRPYRFFAALEEDQLQRRIVESVLNGLIAQFPQAVATYFAQNGLAGGKSGEATQELVELSRRLEEIRSAGPVTPEMDVTETKPDDSEPE